MEQVQIPAFSDPLPVPIPLLKEKPRQGVPGKNPAPHPGHELHNSTVAIGLRAALYLDAVRSRSTGKEHDSESGNDYFGARYYASAMGRFLSPDWALVPTPIPFATLDNPQSLNLYSYVANNPLRDRDADGHHQECDPDTSSTDPKTGTVTVTAGKCHEVSDGPWWLAFNPWGKLGGPAHRQTVQKLAEMLRNDGYEVSTEVKVNTPLGAKGSRYVDVVGVKKRTGETKMYQVGDKNKDGTPVSREQKALDDIQQETGVQPQFVDKGLGQRMQDIEDGITPGSPLMPGESESDTDVPEVPEIPEIPPV
jgi:RHS repeat-associated protein